MAERLPLYILPDRDAARSVAYASAVKHARRIVLHAGKREDRTAAVIAAINAARSGVVMR